MCYPVTSFFKVCLVSICLVVGFYQSINAQENPVNSELQEKHQQKLVDSIKDAIQELDTENNLRSSKEFFIGPTYGKSQDSYTVKEVTNPKKNGGTGYISDPNDYISASEEQELNSIIWAMEKKSSAQIAVVMLPSIGDEIPKNFAVDLFKEWGIGQADTDNGLLILTVMDQRRTEFETGDGLQPILTDVVCYRIGTSEIIPNFREGNYGKGLISAVKKVQLFLNDPDAIAEIYSNKINHPPSNKKGIPVVLFYILGIYAIICSLFFIGYYGVAYDIERSKDDYYDKYHRLKKLKVGCLLFLFPIPLVYFNKLIKKRLKRYRYAPRFSSINGKQLFIKDEWAENAFLERAQILEESIEAIRYDVWVTDDESDILVLEYEGSSRKYSHCQECDYKTFGKSKTVVLKSANYNRSGERKIYYDCRNCHYKEEKIEIIPQLVQHTSSSGSSSSSSFGGGSSSSGSSSFGGGSSSGGGAGVSW